jgi:predicted ester cyclase
MKSIVGMFIVVLVIGLVFGGMAVAQSTSKTDANIELVRKHHEQVFSKGNVVVADEIYSNEVVRHSADFPDIRGREAYKQFMLGTREGFSDWKETIENIIASGDFAATKVTATGTMTGPLRGPTGPLPPTGKRVELPCAVIWRFAEGKIVEIWAYYDSVRILEAIGALPPPPPK